MSEPHSTPPGPETHRGHQPDAVSVRGVLVVGAVVGGVVLVVLAFLAFLQQRLIEREAPPREAPAAWQADRTLPPEHDQPKLLRELRAYEEQTLREYAWVDDQKTAARIPIERAMTLLLEEGFPAEAPPSDAAAPQTDPTPVEANPSGSAPPASSAPSAQPPPNNQPPDAPPPAEPQNETNPPPEDRPNE